MPSSCLRWLLQSLLRMTLEFPHCTALAHCLNCNLWSSRHAEESLGKFRGRESSSSSPCTNCWIPTLSVFTPQTQSGLSSPFFTDTRELQFPQRAGLNCEFLALMLNYNSQYWTGTKQTQVCNVDRCQPIAFPHTLIDTLAPPSSQRWQLWSHLWEDIMMRPLFPWQQVVTGGVRGVEEGKAIFPGTAQRWVLWELYRLMYHIVWGSGTCAAS